MYIGNLTNCYTQAILTAASKINTYESLMNFEIATTVPFGIKFKNNDVNRIIDCYIDPDKGIDRALDILGIPYEMMCWPKYIRHDEPLTILDKWIKEGSQVVVGPLNMGELNYLFQSNLLQGMDHYIVIMEKNDNHYYVCDSEGVSYAILTLDQLHMACISGDIREGRGSYTIRRVLAKIEQIKLSESMLQEILYLSMENIILASKDEYGGSNGIFKFAENFSLICNNPSMIRGLKYRIQNRIQRCMLSIKLLKMCKKKLVKEVDISILNKLIYLYEKQIELYSCFLSALFEKINLKNNNIINMIMEIKELEDKIVQYFTNIFI